MPWWTRWAGPPRWRWRVRRGSAPSCATPPRSRSSGSGASRPRRATTGCCCSPGSGASIPTSLDAYRASGGYEALARALELGRAGGHRRGHRREARRPRRGRVPHRPQVGRGRGAARARRTTSCATRTSPSPGTFKDRLHPRGGPVRARRGDDDRGLRRRRVARLPVPPRRVPAGARAAASTRSREARAAGLLGDDVQGSGWAFDIELRIGAGAYIVRRGDGPVRVDRGRPRASRATSRRSPWRYGLFGKPTAVNNVETLVNVPADPAHGRARRTPQIGTEGSTGPKLFCLSGHVTTPGRLRGHVRRRRWAGCSRWPAASRAGAPIQAILLGGAAGAFVGPDRLDTPLTFEGTRAVGATLGSGVVMVFDETADLPDALRRIAAFFRDESCGQCVPCRVGTVRQEELLARLAGGAPLDSVDGELALLRRSRARRCATPRSAGSARRRPRRSRARCGSGSCNSSGRPPDGDRPHPVRPAGPADERPGRAAGPPRRHHGARHRRHGRQRPHRIDDPRGARSLGIDTPTLCYVGTSPR